MLPQLLGAASNIAPLVSGLGGQPTAMMSRADSSARTDISSSFNTGSFNLGGTKTTNTLFWVVGIVALIFLLKHFFKRK